MSAASANVQLRLHFSDKGAVAGFKTVEQAQRSLQSQINATQRRFDDLAKSGKLSQNQLAAAATKARETQAALRKEMERVNETVGGTAVAKYAANMEARKTLGIRAEKDIQNEIKKTERAYQTLAKSGVLNSQQLARAYDAQISKIKVLRNEMGEVSKMQKLLRAAEIGGGLLIGGRTAKSIIDSPVKSYADLESAQADLKIAMMGKGGKVSAAYGDIMSQAVALGNRLPGSTKDFVAAATALKEQGMTDSAIVGGGLTASANFGVLANMDQYQAATTIAKMREAYGLSDNELPLMADYMQKARYAYGIQPDDFKAVASYAAPTYNTLGLTGSKSARELLAVQGMAASVGLENTSFGTNFSMMLGRTSQIDARLGGNGEAAKQAREALDEFGIKLNFFNKEGKFAGIENMFAELDKLKPLTDIDRMHVLDKLFGVEASRPASIMIAKGGSEAYRESLAKLDSQAGIDERIGQKTATLLSKEESLSGTWENTKASAGKGLGEVKKLGLDAVNELLTASQFTLDKSPALGTTLTSTAAIGGGLGATAAGLGLWNQLTGASLKLPGAATVSSLAQKIPMSVPKGVGLFSLASSAAGLGLSSIAGEGSSLARYGSAALSGAGLGATVGSLVPAIGTAVGGVVGAAVATLTQAITDAFARQDPKPTELNARFEVRAAPGYQLVSQGMQTSGPGNISITGNTGNAFTGAPGSPR